MPLKRHCQVAKLKRAQGEVVVFKRLYCLYLAMSLTRNIQTTQKAIKRQSDIARLPSSKTTLPNYEKEELGNVATELEITICDLIWAVDGIDQLKEGRLWLLLSNPHLL
jgi:hypothetical protein